MLTDSGYELLRQLASPVVAVTSAWGGRANGMILDSAVRASISPEFPRLSVYVHKWHLSHEFIWNSGAFVAHLLHRQQFELIYRLGFQSGRESDKMSGLESRSAQVGAPVLADCFAAFECRVINTMDAGASTAFLADIVATHRGPGAEVMTAEYFRGNLPPDWKEAFLKNYREAQERIGRMADIEDIRWEGPKGR